MQLLLEAMEERIVPTQIGQFSFAASNDYTNTNNGSSVVFGTTAAGSSGLFQYQNIANLPAFLTGPLSSHLVLTMSSNCAASIPSVRAR